MKKYIFIHTTKHFTIGFRTNLAGFQNLLGLKSMRDFLSIIFIIGFFLFPVFWTPSWAQSQMQEQPNQSFGQLQSELSSRNLSKQQLSSFEKRGLEKIQEFIDYQQIISDKAYDDKMKKHAIKLALSSFMDSSKIRRFDADGEILIENYLNRLMAGTAKAFSVEKLIIKDSFSPQNPITFKGIAELSFSSGETRSITLWLVLKNKEIGAQTLEIWTILLGDFL